MRVRCTAFWFRFRKVVHAIRAAKPDKTWSLRPLAPRIGRFVWEVLLQGKVILDRPLPGSAHAFVFWGFCAFALVTVNHLAAGFGFTLIPRDSARRQHLLRIRRRVRGRGRGLDCGTRRAAVPRAAGLAGQSVR